MKICPKCNIKKPVNEFDKNERRPDGLSWQCKICRKKYYQKNIKEIKKKTIKYQAEYFQQKIKEYRKTPKGRQKRREYCQKPEVKKKIREYRRLPSTKKYQKKYHQEYYQKNKNHKKINEKTNQKRQGRSKNMGIM